MSGLYQRKSESLEGLTDVDITNIQNGQAPVYDATTQVYTNQTVLLPSSLPSGSSGDVIISNGTGGIESTINLNVNTPHANTSHFIIYTVLILILVLVLPLKINKYKRRDPKDV